MYLFIFLLLLITVSSLISYIDMLNDTESDDLNNLNDDFEVYFHVISKDFNKIKGYFYVEHNGFSYKIFNTINGWVDYKTIRYSYIRLSSLFDTFEELKKMSISFISDIFDEYQFQVLDDIRITFDKNFEISIFDFKNINKELELIKKDFNTKFKMLKKSYAELNKIIEGGESYEGKV